MCFTTQGQSPHLTLGRERRRRRRIGITGTSVSLRRERSKWREGKGTTTEALLPVMVGVARDMCLRMEGVMAIRIRTQSITIAIVTRSIVTVEERVMFGGVAGGGEEVIKVGVFLLVCMHLTMCLGEDGRRDDRDSSDNRRKAPSNAWARGRPSSLGAGAGGGVPKNPVILKRNVEEEAPVSGCN